MKLWPNNFLESSPIVLCNPLSRLATAIRRGSLHGPLGSKRTHEFVRVLIATKILGIEILYA